MKATAALVLVGSVAGGAGLGMRARPDPPGPARPTAAVADADDHRYRAAFQGGASVEVVAVSTVPTGPNTWWKPDGTPLAEAPVDAIAGHYSREPERRNARLILVQSAGVRRDDLFRWHPTRYASYWGGSPTKDGQRARELEYYEATFDPVPKECEVNVRLANGEWTTEVSNDGGGGVGTFVHGHKFSFGKARAYSSRGRSMTVFAVAHNFLGRDRRLVAIDRDGMPHVGHPSSGSDGDPRWVVDIIDAEFDLPPDRIKEYQVQFRPYEETEIKGIALEPRPSGR